MNYSHIDALNLLQAKYKQFYCQRCGRLFQAQSKPSQNNDDLQVIECPYCKKSHTLQRYPFKLWLFFLLITSLLFALFVIQTS